MSFSDTRHPDPVQSLHSRISLLTTHDDQYSKILSKIIDRFDISQEQSRQKQKLIERFSRIISSQREPSINQDEKSIAYTLHKQLQESQGFDVAFRFGHLYNKLASRQRAQKKWSILYLFSLLNNDNLHSLDSPGLHNIDHELSLPPTSRPYDIDDDLSRNTRRKITSSSDNEPPAVLLARARWREVHVSESELLRDLIFLFQGIDGQYIRYDAVLNDHIIVPGTSISRSTQDMVLKLAEIGWLYIKVRNFIRDTVHTPSLVGQSLCAALQQELTTYYKLIAILEVQIEKQLKNRKVTEQTLTLKRLVVWTLDCHKKLRLMSVLTDVCHEKGGALLSVIHNYTNHGDPFIKTYLIELLQVVSKPFYEMLERWVYEGELDDPYSEFFVACDSKVSQEDLWQSKYTLRQDMLPSFMSKELAHKIFSIGKSLNFIRYSCHDDILSQQYYTCSEDIPRESFKYGETEMVEKCIETAYTKTSKALLELLKTKYKLMGHLKALKRYMLLGQGDFIQYLMDILWVNLSKPANTLFRHNLTGILETAVRSSNAQYDDPDIISRLDVRLLEIQKDDLGWDVFSLEYHVDAPINTVFNPASMQQYLKIFTFLWGLKRVEYALSAAWRQWGKARREFTKLEHMKQDIQYAQLAIQRMIHFIYQLQHYVLFEVLESSWNKLETFIETRSTDLDSIIDAHTKYLDEITEKGFLSGRKGEALARRLERIFDCVLKYSTILDVLYKYTTSTRQDADRLCKIRKRHQEMEEDFTSQVLEFLHILKSYHDEDLRSLSRRLDYNDFYFIIKT